jgi:hypothetical protein
LVFAAALLVAGSASAQSIIKNPGDHVSSVELEPHLTLRTAFFDGIGGGFRATVPIVSNGFVSTINDSVGIGFGLDYIDLRPCNGCSHVGYWVVPVVMQWNFYLTKSWSVFGEPGVAINLNRPTRCDHCEKADLMLQVGARWHFGQYTALTMRLGWPYASIGVSFL